MTAEAPIPHFSGSSSQAARFAQLNIHSHMRLQTYVSLCLPSVSQQMTERFGLFDLRRQGTALIVYSLEIENRAVPLAYGRPLEDAYTARLSRVREAPSGGRTPPERLVIDSRFDLFGYARSGGSEEMGYDDGSGARVQAGRARMLQVFTRPLAPPGERHVGTAPGAFAALQEHAWDEPWPTVETLGAAPAGHTPVEQPVPPRLAVWGTGNTDLNQHVTLTEYIREFDSHCSLQLHLAGLDVARHHVDRCHMIFRKPFFPGNPYAVDGKLYVQGGQTVLTVGIFAARPDGTPTGTPAVFARLAGSIGDHAG